MANTDERRDLEASFDDKDGSVERFEVDVGSINEVKRTRELQNKISIFRHMGKVEEWLDKKMGVETQGIDRIPEEQKRPPSIWNVCVTSTHENGRWTVYSVKRGVRW
jgi:hypothetical protein